VDKSQKKLPTKPNDGEYPRKVVQCDDGETSEERGRNYAKLITSPELAAYRVIDGVEQKSGIEVQLDVPTLVKTLRDQAKAVNDGDLAQAEAMLANQATSLQSLYARLTEKAFSSTQLPHFDSFMRMALRAQNQCRATLETLAALKNPPVVIAKQANVTSGPQQVNNGIAASRAREIENKQIQLSAENNELRTNTRTPPLTGRINQEMETVGKIHRPKNRRR
jgi:hypothetical protein